MPQQRMPAWLVSDLTVIVVGLRVKAIGAPYDAVGTQSQLDDATQ